MSHRGGRGEDGRVFKTIGDDFGTNMAYEMRGKRADFLGGFGSGLRSCYNDVFIGL